MPQLAIIGPGTLGLSLARLAAERGLEVRLAGRDLDHARRGLARLEASWARAMAKGNLDPTACDEALICAQACPSWEAACEGSDFILEALPEDKTVKIQAWQRLGARVGMDTLCLTASSSLPLGELREGARLDYLLGFHLFVPVHRMGIVELVREAQAPEGRVARARELADRLGLEVAEVRDQPGYAATRMALAQGLEAMRLLERGVASARDLDRLMVRGYGHPLGPLELSDRIGLDLRLAIAEELYGATGDARFEPPELLRRLVAEGHCGRKSGRGFHIWEESCEP